MHRRKPKENNFKPVLESIRDLMNEDVIIPHWLRDIFLGALCRCERALCQKEGCHVMSFISLTGCATSSGVRCVAVSVLCVMRKDVMSCLDVIPQWLRDIFLGALCCCERALVP